MLRTIVLFAAAAWLAPSSPAQTLQPPFAGAYTLASLGPVPGLPAFQSAITFQLGDPSRLLLAANADRPNGAIYEVQVARDAAGHITGFLGNATLFASAPFIDDGLQYGPGGVLFYTSYPSNELGQILPGNTAPNRTTPLAAYGMTGSVGALAFVPNGNAAAGELKLASYDTGAWWGFTATSIANGTFDLTISNGPAAVSGGPEGITYVPPGSRLLPDRQRVLVTEFNTGTLALYPLDAQANPIANGRVPFLTGIAGPEGSAVDPITGDLVFGLFAGGVVVVHGFGVCGGCSSYGLGIAGSQGPPQLSGGGCFGRGQSMSFDVSGGVPAAPGLLALGVLAAHVPLGSGALLVQPMVLQFHLLDPSGAWSSPQQLPASPTFSGLNLVAQSLYLDAAASGGIAATAGLRVIVR